MEQLKRRLKKMTGKSARIENAPPLSPPRFKSKKIAKLSTCERPAPLGERKRPLTPPSAPGALSHQEQSLFFSKLPIDIRLMIYDSVLTIEYFILQVLGDDSSLADVMEPTRTHEAGVIDAGARWAYKQKMVQQWTGPRMGLSLQDLLSLGYFVLADACEKPHFFEKTT
ncbi:hypothetical protein N7478_001199 [Penicillium angulare]|uniref:uncharacterized protein n=1 Tax=Penicillium angulare TaxID=116970 RepID=UPI002541FA56|nr:uncharacterized protein N7478_001199 [Penicillium angulare]KAJ5291948.1 hypothetical protein N7478_001199 [Penicillium angulare]